MYSALRTSSGNITRFTPRRGFSSHAATPIACANRHFVDVTGAAPAIGGQLILDVLTSGGVAPVSERSTWALLLIDFAGLGYSGYRRTRNAGRPA
jgi:hypothetical protein